MHNCNIEDISVEDFQAFEQVRQYGRWNMFDTMAKQSTGLSDDKYFGIIHHYTELKEIYKANIKDEPIIKKE